MADGHPITGASGSALVLTIREINALADRLFSRGVSKLAADTPQQARDLRIAARLLWLLGPELGATRIINIDAD